MLKIRDIEFSYKTAQILNGIDMDVGVHELLSILGPNGVGKSTLLKCINGLLKTRKGHILVNGENLKKMKRVEVAKRLGYVPQRAEVSQITVFDSVLLGRKPHITWDVSKKDMQITKDAITRFGMDALSLKYIDEISGGELQKVQIARALVQEPKVLLLDEPISSFDLPTKNQVMSAIVDVVKQTDLTVIMTLYDINFVLWYSDKFILLKAGTIFTVGEHEVITPASIEAVYGFRVNAINHMGRLIMMPL